MLALLTITATFAATAYETESLPDDASDAPVAPEPVAVTAEVLGDFDHAAFRADADRLESELATVLAADGWRQVQPGLGAVPVTAEYAFLQGALTVDPVFLTTSRTGHAFGDEYGTGGFASNAKILRDEQGRVRAAAGGVRSEGGACGGSWTTYTDWLVTYDEDGNPVMVFTTANEYGDALVRHTLTVGVVEYDGDEPIGLDVRSRSGWLGCDLCESSLLGTQGYDDVSWLHTRLALAPIDDTGC